MNTFETLIAQLKISVQDMGVLHRNLVGTGWEQTHKQLEDYYGRLGEITDDMIEVGISQGIEEISIAEAVMNITVLTVESRTEPESLVIVQRILTDIAEAMDGVMEEIEDGWIISKLEAYQEWLCKEADYKIAQRLK